MADDLFPESARFEQLALKDADVSFLRALELSAPPEDVMKALIESVPWKAEEIVLWGKRVMQPRLTAWYGDEGSHYRYSGLALAPLPWTPLLADIKRRVEAAVGVGFNSVLMNLYRDHRDSVGLHSDDEKELGAHPVIASLSLGAQRSFVLKHKTSRSKPLRIELASGTLLLMKGATQRHWKHGIEKQGCPCGPRVNLTFRHIQTGSLEPESN